MISTMLNQKMTKKVSNNKHIEIYDWLLTQIKEKKICVGEQLPTEKSIVERFGVNRTTVRTAMSKLEKADMIIRRSGKGTFLIRDTHPQLARTLNKLEVVSQDSVSGNTDFKTIEKKWGSVPDDIRMMLNGKGKELLSFKRIISLDGELALLERTFLNDKLSAVFEDLDTNQSYYPLIEKYGQERISHVKISFTSRQPTQEEQTLLGIDQHHPCIAMQSLLYNDEEVVLEVLESLYRGDKYTFTMESTVELPFSLKNKR
ncbi:GntR family transcriptional regulator [Desulforhopalus sp. 52FAK]